MELILIFVKFEFKKALWHPEPILNIPELFKSCISCPLTFIILMIEFASVLNPQPLVIVKLKSDRLFIIPIVLGPMLIICWNDFWIERITSEIVKFEKFRLFPF